MQLSLGLLAGSAAKGQGPAFLATGHRSGSRGPGRGLAHRIESHSRVWFWDGLGLSLRTAPRMDFVLSRPVSFNVAAIGYMWLIFTLIKINQNRKCSSSVAFTTFQILRSHKWLASSSHIWQGRREYVHHHRKFYGTVLL